MHPLRQVLRQYEWVHLTLGFIGNTCFVIGSVLFLWESTKEAGVWLFIIGATGMWIGTTGSGIVNYASHRDERRRVRQERAGGRDDRRTHDHAAE